MSQAVCGRAYRIVTHSECAQRGAVRAAVPENPAENIGSESNVSPLSRQKYLQRDEVSSAC